MVVVLTAVVDSVHLHHITGRHLTKRTPVVVTLEEMNIVAEVESIIGRIITMKATSRSTIARETKDTMRENTIGMAMSIIERMSATAAVRALNEVAKARIDTTATNLPTTNF